MVNVFLANTYVYKNTRFWPESGMIWIEDTNTGEAQAITRKQALLRAKSINDMINFYPHASERDEQHKLVSDLIECVRKAKEQGDPTDPEVIKQKVAEAKRTSRAKILLPPAGIKLNPNAKPLDLPGLRKVDF